MSISACTRALDSSKVSENTEVDKEVENGFKSVKALFRAFIRKNPSGGLSN